MLSLLNKINILFKKMNQKIDENKLISDAKGIEYAHIHVWDFYEQIDGVFSKELKEKFLEHFTMFFSCMNIPTPNFREKSLREKIQKFFNKIMNLFLMKYDIEGCTIGENILFYCLLKQYSQDKIISEDASCLIKSNLIKIFENNKSFLTLILLEWISKNYEWDDSEFKIDITNNSHFIKIIKIAISNANESNLDDVIENLDFIFSQNVGEYRNNIYQLIKHAKIHINNLLSTHFNELISQEEFWTKPYLVRSYQKIDAIIYESEFKKYEKIILIDLGFSLQKNIKIDLKSRLLNIIQNSKKNPEKAKILDIKESFIRDWLDIFNQDKINEIYVDKYLYNPQAKTQEKKGIFNNKFIEERNVIIDINKIRLLSEFDKKFKEENVGEWFLNNLNSFIKEYYQNNKEFNDFEMIEKEIYWKKSIYFLFKNQKYILETKKNKPYYIFLKYVDFAKCSPLMGKNYAKISEDLKQEVQNKIYSTTRIDNEKNYQNIKNVYGSYLSEKELKQIDEVALVDNSCLSLMDCFKFSSYEFMGDIIYKMIINSLMLDAKIYVDNQNIYSAKIQEKISKSLNINNNIMYDESISSLQKKEVSDADYFETLIYFIFKIKGFKFCKDFVFDLIKKNYQDIVVPNYIYEQVSTDFENFTKNKIANYYKKEFIYSCLMDYSELWISKSKPTKFIKIETLQKEILLCCFKLILITSEKLGHFISYFDVNSIYKEAYTKTLHDTANSLLINLFTDYYNYGEIDKTALNNLIYDFNDNYEKFISRLTEIITKELKR